MIDKEGYIKITDRLKDVIKTGGEWVSSIDLEDLILKHDAVAEAAVIGVPIRNGASVPWRSSLPSRSRM